MKIRLDEVKGTHTHVIVVLINTQISESILTRLSPSTNCGGLGHLLLVVKALAQEEGGGGRGQPPPNNLRVGGGVAKIPFGPPIIHPPFLQFLCESVKNHKCTKLKGKIIINVALI